MVSAGRGRRGRRAGGGRALDHTAHLGPAAHVRSRTAVRPFSVAGIAAGGGALSSAVRGGRGGGRLGGRGARLRGLQVGAGAGGLQQAAAGGRRGTAAQAVRMGGCGRMARGCRSGAVVLTDRWSGAREEPCAQQVGPVSLAFGAARAEEPCRLRVRFARIGEDEMGTCVRPGRWRPCRCPGRGCAIEGAAGPRAGPRALFTR